MDKSNQKELMIECESIVKIYKTKDIEVLALQGLDMTIEKGEMTAIIGNSGSGKSTLLNMLGGLDRPSVGKLKVDGVDLGKLKEKELQKYMLETVGFIWQNNARNLIPYMTALQNVEMPLMVSKTKNRRERALELLDKVGMGHRIHNKLGELSGGEQQRIAMAIALANNPKLLLADEPTGSVDSENTHKIMELFRKINREDGVTILIVTHDRELSQMVDRVIMIRDGRTSSEYIAKNSYANQIETLEKLNQEAIEETHDEYILVDKVGRLQLPKAFLNQMGVTGKDKVKVYYENGKILIEK